MRTILGFLLIVMLAALPALGQAPTTEQPAAPGQSHPVANVQKVPVITLIRKTVGYVELTCQRGLQGYSLTGTGFFVIYPDARLGKDKGFGYLLTNRHVAECWDDDNNPLTVTSVGARLNLKTGSSQLLTLNPSGNVPWAYPDDPSVDLAALPLFPDQNTFDFLGISISEFATDDVVTSQSIAEGDRILFTGFFSKFPGERKIQPIVREGTLAMMPDEPVPTTTKQPGKVYLGDVHAFYGNSGSPVFVNLGGMRGGSLIMGESYKLLGVVSGMLTEDEDLNLEAVTSLRGKIHANSGIAMIIPASIVKALLDGTRLRTMRDEVVKAQQQQSNNCGAPCGSFAVAAESLPSGNKAAGEPVLRFPVSLTESLITTDSVRAAKH